jgi:hypothetical protein
MLQKRQDSTTAFLLIAFCMVVFAAGGCLQQARAQEKELWKKQTLGAAAIPLPERIAQADLVVVGRVTAVENENFEAKPLPGSADKPTYRVLGMKADETLLGDKMAKKIRVGFIVKATPTVPPPQMLPIKVGWEGLFFLKKHHQEDFYINFAFFGGFVPSGGPEFAQTLEVARKMANILHDPVAALKVGNASNRYLAVAMLIGKFRQPVVKGQQYKEEPIDAGVSKLLLKALAEADWKYDAAWLLETMYYPAHPYHLFQQLGVTKADGYDPPTSDLRDTLAATQKWLLDHQEKYRVKRLTFTAK